MRGLAEEAGLAVNTVYALFGRSRDDILKAILEEGVADLDRMLHEKESDDPLAVGPTLAATVADYLIERKESAGALLDPTGERALSNAKMLNRTHGGRKTTRQDELADLADEWFALPEELPGWWEKRLAAEGMWIDLVHLKAILMRPRESALARAAKNGVEKGKRKVRLRG